MHGARRLPVDQALVPDRQAWASTDGLLPAQGYRLGEQISAGIEEHACECVADANWTATHSGERGCKSCRSVMARTLARRTYQSGNGTTVAQKTDAERLGYPVTRGDQGLVREHQRLLGHFGRSLGSI